jgi:hypothetical protein
MKQFTIGFVVATAIWLVALSLMDIPEYTVVYKCITV